MNQFPWQCHCTMAERRAVRPSSEAVDDGSEETEANAANRVVFTRVRAGATELAFIVSEVVRCRETESAGAETERHSELAANIFSLPLFHAPLGQSDRIVQLNDWQSTIIALRSAKGRPLRAPFTERTANSTQHRANSPPLYSDRLGGRITTESADGRWPHQDADQASQSSSSSLSNLLSAAQQYLQALRENISPPAELREAWDAFYQACDPLVRRTVAACSLHRADADDCAQEAWAEITTKLTRFEYDPNRGSFESWLRIVVNRAACHHARRDHRQTAGRIDQDLAGVKCPRLLGPAMATQREELRVSVRQTLDAFRPSVSKTAFRILLLSTVEGQTSPEIGKHLGLTPGHVRVTRHRTAQKFRQFVAKTPALAAVFGISLPPSEPVEVSGNQ